MASRVVGNIDVVVDGVTGLFAERGASSARDKIVLLLQDAQLCDELGRHGRERSSKNFRWRGWSRTYDRCIRTC